MRAMDAFRYALQVHCFNQSYGDKEPACAIVSQDLFGRLHQELKELATVKTSKPDREKFKRRNGRAPLEYLGVSVYCSPVEDGKIMFGYSGDPCE